MRKDESIYRSFEQFEREELRRMETLGATVDEMIETIFGDYVSGAPAGGRAERDDEDDDE